MDQDTRDASSLKLELDRGLSSGNFEHQIRAVECFNNLFSKNPSPILINAAFIKLAETFNNGSNFIRVHICDAFQANQDQLKKIYEVDKFYRNIFTVTTSNDPIARSITLLTLGHIASIISDYRSIHYCISSSLETSVEFELNATIASAACYVKHSSEFACNIYPKIVSIIDSNKSSIDTKIRALSVLDHDFYRANDALVVRSFLINIIETSDLKKLICPCLTLSTKIAHNSLTHITSQIELLLRIFLNDSRQVIKVNALRNLQFLAEKKPHIWESSHVDPLVSQLEQIVANDQHKNTHHPFITTIVAIFCKLLTCKCNFILQQDKNRIFHQSYKLALNTQNLALCSMAFELLTVMSEEHFQSMTKNIIDCQPNDGDTDTLNAIKTFLTQSSVSVHDMGENDDMLVEQQVNDVGTKSIYRHIVKLCRLNPNYCSELGKLIFTRISSKDTSLRYLDPYYTELMCAISQFSGDYTITPDNCWKLIRTKSSNCSEKNLLNLCVLYFQTSKLSKNSPKVADGLVEKVTSGHDLWFTYKVLRQAMRYGHFKIAGLLCDYINEQVTTDTMDFYFKALRKICAAEATLSKGSDIDGALETCISLYEDSTSPLLASVGNTKTATFQLQFLWLRIRTLQAHSSLRQCCKIYELSPITYSTFLSAIGTSRMAALDYGVSKLGFIQQMPKIAKDFRHLGYCYENLPVVTVNCDNRTLEYVHLLKSSCVIMADAIDAIFQYGKNLPVISKLSTGTDKKLALEHRALEMTCNKLIESIRNDILKPGIFPSQRLIEPTIVLLKTFSDELLDCSFIYPRYFFQPSA